MPPREKPRFGVTLAEHRSRKRGRLGLSPKAREIAGDLRTLDYREKLKAGFARETERLEAARARLAEQRWARERADRASRVFDDALGRAFAEPAKARKAFEGRAHDVGAARVAEEMRRDPDQFGRLRDGEKRGVFGLRRAPDRDLAKEAAWNAAELGRESVTAERRAPDAATLTRAEQAVARAELRVRQLGDRLDRTRDNARTRIRIGLAMRTLAPREVADLHRVITAPHRQLTVELGRAARKLAPEHLRDLMHWARAPHLALPSSAARSFRALLNDRKVERGSE